jgi:hypothetical protein
MAWKITHFQSTHLYVQRVSLNRSISCSPSKFRQSGGQEWWDVNSIFTDRRQCGAVVLIVTSKCRGAQFCWNSMSSGPFSSKIFDMMSFSNMAGSTTSVPMLSEEMRSRNTFFSNIVRKILNTGLYFEPSVTACRFNVLLTVHHIISV